jgi:hypothetical protein
VKLFYGGGEIDNWRKLLLSQGVTHVSLSFVGLKRRTDYDLSSKYPGQEVFLDSGAYTYNRPDSKFDFEDAYETAAQYMEFVKANVDSVTLVSEFDARQLGDDTIEEMRSNFYNMLPPDKFMPIWHPESGRDELERLCSSYSVVGVCQSDIHGDTAHVPVFNSYIQRYGTRLHGVGITSKKLLEAVKWDSVSSTSWLSPSRFGDTFVWDGRELHRYPKDYKHKRMSHRVLFIDNGFDYAKIEADDSEELLKLSLWSWQQYIAHISGVTTMPRNVTTGFREAASGVVDTHASVTGTGSLSSALAKPRETTMLPIMRTVFKENKDDEEEPLRPHLIVRSESMRVCDSCFLKDKCPGFQPDSTCLYNIPIEVRTKDQLQALHDALLEMQTHRVLFMKMAEDLGGGYADPNLSSEIDRLNRMIKTKTDSNKNVFSATLNISEEPSGPGFMERMFGPGAASKLKELDAPQDADVIIAEVIENVDSK